MTDTLEVIVVTSTELGWDCVMGVYPDYLLEELQKLYDGPPYVLTKITMSFKAPTE